MKIRQLGAELIHADGRTDLTKLTVTFRNFANAHKKKQTLQDPNTCNKNLINLDNGECPK